MTKYAKSKKPIATRGQYLAWLTPVNLDPSHVRGLIGSGCPWCGFFFVLLFCFVGPSILLLRAVNGLESVYVQLTPGLVDQAQKTNLRGSVPLNPIGSEGWCKQVICLHLAAHRVDCVSLSSMHKLKVDVNLKIFFF